MTDAFAHSCDVYFYDVGHRAGIDAIAAAAKKLGLGAIALGIDLPGERPGLVPTRAWKQKTIGETWQQGETLINAIGQGFVKATPLQLAVMTARLAGGMMVEPHLTRQVERRRANAHRLAGYESRQAVYSEAILAGMVAVTQYGTGAHCQIP